eukprot:COSAG02_NODE_6870_length_3315_cov_1.293843_2_plen_202_part_00
MPARSQHQGAVQAVVAVSCISRAWSAPRSGFVFCADCLPIAWLWQLGVPPCRPAVCCGVWAPRYIPRVLRRRKWFYRNLVGGGGDSETTATRPRHCMSRSSSISSRNKNSWVCAGPHATLRNNGPLLLEKAANEGFAAPFSSWPGPPVVLFAAGGGASVYAVQIDVATTITSAGAPPLAAAVAEPYRPHNHLHTTGITRFC